MFLFAVAHGARASEIAALRLADLNLKQGTVHIARLKGSLDSTQNFLKVKGNPLSDEERGFRTWLAERRPDANSFIFDFAEVHSTEPRDDFQAVPWNLRGGEN